MIRIAFFFASQVCSALREKKTSIARHAIKGKDENSSTSGGNLMTIKRWVMLLVCAAFSIASTAADMYRWVDENGRVSVSDNVPARYRDVATKINTNTSNISDSQRQEAQERADQERQRAKASVDAAKTASPQSAPVKTGEIKPPRNKAETECEALIRAYRESQECFEPFRIGTTDGSFLVRDEAFQYCTSIPAPFDKCAPPSY